MKREDMNKLKELREANNLTQQQLADMLGLDRSTICKWEVGINFPRGATLIKLARIFECTTDELLLGTDGLDENLSCDDSDCGHDEKSISVIKKSLLSHMRRLNESADKTNNVDELFSIALAMQSITDAIVSLETEDI